MSGGSYDYAYRKLEDFADSLRSVGGCYAAPRAIRDLFREHVKLVARAMQAIEWNDSSDGNEHETKLITACLNGESLPNWIAATVVDLEREIQSLKDLHAALCKERGQ